ncbi:MAG: metalloregulator ArsR/SmtB family transcription factor [Bacillota bacterium]
MSSQREDRCEEAHVNEELVAELRPKLLSLSGICEIFRALGDDSRSKIAYALSQAELCVCDIASLLGITPQVASYHLRILRNLKLVKSRREGKMVYYSLNDDHVKTLVIQAVDHLNE